MKLFNKIIKDQSGVYALTTALLLPGTLLFMGLAMGTLTLVNNKSHMADASEAAALAVAKADPKGSSEGKEIAIGIYKSYFPYDIENLDKSVVVSYKSIKDPTVKPNPEIKEGDYCAKWGSWVPNNKETCVEWKKYTAESILHSWHFYRASMHNGSFHSMAVGLFGTLGFDKFENVSNTGVAVIKATDTTSYTAPVVTKPLKPANKSVTLGIAFVVDGNMGDSNYPRTSVPPKPPCAPGKFKPYCQRLNQGIYYAKAQKKWFDKLVDDQSIAEEPKVSFDNLGIYNMTRITSTDKTFQSYANDLSFTPFVVDSATGNLITTYYNGQGELVDYKYFMDANYSAGTTGKLARIMDDATNKYAVHGSSEAFPAPPFECNIADLCIKTLRLKDNTALDKDKLKSIMNNWTKASEASIFYYTSEIRQYTPLFLAYQDLNAIKDNVKILITNTSGIVYNIQGMENICGALVNDHIHLIAIQYPGGDGSLHHRDPNKPNFAMLHLPICMSSPNFHLIREMTPDESFAAISPMVHEILKSYADKNPNNPSTPILENNINNGYDYGNSSIKPSKPKGPPVPHTEGLPVLTYRGGADTPSVP